MTTYAGYDVLEVKPSRDGARRDDYNRSFAILGNKRGARKSDDRAQATITGRPFMWHAYTRAEVSVLRAFLLARRGRAVPFWVATDDADLIPTVAIGSTDTAITIKAAAYTQQCFARRARRRLAFNDRSRGATVYAKVTSAVDNGNGTETLTLSAAIGATIALPNLVISYLLLCRLGDDIANIRWETASVASAELHFVEVPNEVPA